jgi:hypothetical protein
MNKIIFQADQQLTITQEGPVPHTQKFFNNITTTSSGTDKSNLTRSSP